MNVLEVENLVKEFSKNRKKFKAVNDVSFSIQAGECCGLVGESGSGKSTVAKMVTRLLKVTSGNIRLLGEDITHIKGQRLRQAYRDMAMVFQMPTDSFNPRRKLGQSIQEVLRNAGMNRPDAKQRTLELMDLVELKREYVDRFPHQISGGECQRAAMARALAVNPKLLICDEATSALDVSVQAQIVALLKRLQEELNIAYLLICHDLALVKNICDTVVVMRHGELVEQGTVSEVIDHPQNDYTKLLLASVFPVHPTDFGMVFGGRYTDYQQPLM